MLWDPRSAHKTPRCGRSPDRATVPTVGLPAEVRGQETRAQHEVEDPRTPYVFVLCGDWDCTYNRVGKSAYRETDAMICDGCGRDFAGDEAYDSRSVQTGYAAPWGAKTELRGVCLCPECARRRRGTPWFVVGVIAALVAALALFRLMATWLG